MKLYRFEVRAKASPRANNIEIHRIEASSIIDAKNRLKAKFPNHQIISCVKVGEVDQPSRRPEPNSSVVETVVHSVMGAAVAVGIGFFLKKKMK